MRNRFDRRIGRPADGRLADYERQLGNRIRVARRGAKAGDFFTPEVQAMFRRLLTTSSPEIMALQFSDDDADEDATPQDAARRNVVHVNEQYPEDAPRSRIPFAVLARLPSLPPDIEYRFHGRDLLLHDVRANVVLDIMRNAAQ